VLTWNAFKFRQIYHNGWLKGKINGYIYLLLHIHDMKDEHIISKALFYSIPSIQKQLCYNKKMTGNFEDIKGVIRSRKLKDKSLQN
jgi:hypothetical protein